MIFFAAATAAAATPAPPVVPQVAVVALQAPTIPYITAQAPPVTAETYLRTPPVVVIPLHVRVVAGTQQLFDDTLRVTANSGADDQESRSEAPDIICSTYNYYTNERRSSLTVGVSLRSGVPGPTLVNVNVSWLRPSETPSCGGQGIREVQVAQTLPVGPGQTVTIHGDAGLVITVGR